ncbi:hypothetical protein MFIFM68171_02024 [Madurella fahalii]|uniref:Uncharacterized protein n=1 Tax=Madurella fahalii TaxID=1157608 RepID=A0ABQ0G260_9PEZI
MDDEVEGVLRLVGRHWSHQVIGKVVLVLDEIYMEQHIYVKIVAQAILRGGQDLDSLDYVAMIIGIMAFTNCVTPCSWPTAASKLPEPRKAHICGFLADFNHPERNPIWRKYLRGPLPLSFLKPAPPPSPTSQAVKSLSTRKSTTKRLPGAPPPPSLNPAENILLAQHGSDADDEREDSSGNAKTRKKRLKWLRHPRRHSQPRQRSRHRPGLAQAVEALLARWPPVDVLKQVVSQSWPPGKY